MDQQPLFEIFGLGASFVVYKDYLVIKRATAVGLIYHGMKGDKAIPFSDIAGIQAQPPFLFWNGSLQIITQGNVESQGNYEELYKDENTILVNKENYDKGLQLQKYLAEYKSKSHEKTGSISTADELEKLTNLLQKGAITQDEFERLKKDLLEDQENN